MDNIKKKLLFICGLLFLIISFGATGYIIIEKWSFLDSIYMTIITLSSVGFKEVHSLSDTGQIFTILLIIGGVGTTVYILNTIARFIIEGEFQKIFRRRKLEKELRELKDHYIVCGYGRMGKIICKEMQSLSVKVVAIEKNPEILPNNDSIKNIIFIEGDATNDEILKEVNIDKAKGLISVVSTDTENLYIVLSARELNPDLFIVARAGEKSSEKKLIRAGANKVVSPYRIGALRIANTILRPAVVDFIEFVTKTGNVELQIEEISISKDSKFVGLTIEQCSIGKELNIAIVAIKRPNGEMEFTPTSKTIIQTNDILICLGKIQKLKILEDNVKS